MSVSLHDFHGLPAMVLRAPDGARAVVTLHGGHLVSWCAAGSDQQLLYLSPASRFADGKAIRGGVPVIFPQFSDRGPFVRHGFARTFRWQVRQDVAGTDDGHAQLVMRLTDDAASRSLWPHPFALELTLRVCGNTLDIALACTNTGASDWAFTAALHSYLAVHDVSQVRLQGLSLCRYDDLVDGGHKLQDGQPVRIVGEVDRVYADVPRALQLQAPGPAGLRRFDITQRGFTDVVVWNPGAARCGALDDMPAEGYRQMLCVESASIIDPVLLAAGQSWTGGQTLAVSS